MNTITHPWQWSDCETNTCTEETCEGPEAHYIVNECEHEHIQQISEDDYRCLDCGVESA